ncbi:MAG TPA: hypothetical protein VNW47_06945 [Terriglobales bacterium]|jgi:hypothetical protein|nr:hypothetical protein [Terriglobales bacterium]
MNRQSHLKRTVFAMVISATATAGAANVCQVTAQDGLNSCKKIAQSDNWNALGMCANISDPQSQQACILKAKSDYQSALTSCQDQFTERNQICHKLGGGAYNPTIDPASFSSVIDNPYFPLKPGTTYIYEGPTSSGFIRTEFAVTTKTKLIDGVTCVEIHDQVFTDGELTEDTLDWFAQDKDGSVWYFGEDSDELVNGRISSLGGSWQGGLKGASPGIVMEAHPKAGDFYRQEFLLNTAEDSAGVLDLNQTATVPAGTFHHCLETEEVTGLEPGALEHKFYAPGVGNVLTVDLVTGDTFPLVQIIGN